jgi:N-acetylated-alpha-linked acidic dipeptidase
MVLPHIPVIPMSYRNATQLLQGIRGASLPAPSWQGALPFRYHVGPGPVAARIVVRTDASRSPMKTIWDTFGMIRGAELPNEMVIIGAHRDAWGPGAADNVSGTAAVMETARTFAELAKRGVRPKRTVVFATWDAEEWGLVGSTEYVEDDSLRLMRGAVAYFNLDVAAIGPSFGGGGSPSLRSTLRDVAAHVPDPGGQGTVYAAWRKQSAVADSAEPTMGDPGGGSDFAGFYNHLGIPIADWGFGGPYGVYHSLYDSYHWMAKFGDPTFVRHAAAARIGAAMMLRVANAEVLPYDYVEYSRTLRSYLPPVARALRQRQWDTSMTSVDSALDRFQGAAAELARARDSVLARGAPARSVLDAANASLLQVERSLTRPQGLRTRPWYRNLIYASDEDNGYATMPLPSVNEAIRSGDASVAAAELKDLAGHLDMATRALAAATNALRGGK